MFLLVILHYYFDSSNHQLYQKFSGGSALWTEKLEDSFVRTEYYLKNIWQNFGGGRQTPQLAVFWAAHWDTCDENFPDLITHPDAPMPFKFLVG